MTRGALLGPWIHEEFWPKLYSQADSAAKPVFLPFSAMRIAFKASYAQWATKERLDAAWSEKSGLSDTHPELRDRVEALGEAAAVPACVDVTSAEALLGETSKSIIDEFDRNWWEKEKKEWTSRYQHVSRSTQRLKELSAQPLTALKLTDLQEFAMLSAEFSEPASAKPVLEHLLRQPNGPFPRADYHYGCILLNEGSERGLDHLSAAANADRYLIDASARAGYAYLLKKHGEYRARQWWEKIVPQDDEEE